MLVQDRCTCGGAPGIAARPRSGAVMPLMSRPVNLTVHRRRPVLVTVAVLIALLVGYAAVAVTRASAASPLLSQGKPAIASSVENAGLPASAAVDGNTGTRWSSAFSDPQWLRVDLGATATIDQVVLTWEAAYATAFQIQVSADAATWTSIYSTTSGTGGTQTLAVNGTGRYVRMYGTVRGTPYGYSLWEFQVYGNLATPGCGTAARGCQVAVDLELPQRVAVRRAPDGAVHPHVPAGAVDREGLRTAGAGRGRVDRRPRRGVGRHLDLEGRGIRRLPGQHHLVDGGCGAQVDAQPLRVAERAGPAGAGVAVDGRRGRQAGVLDRRSDGGLALRQQRARRAGPRHRDRGIAHQERDQHRNRDQDRPPAMDREVDGTRHQWHDSS